MTDLFKTFLAAQTIRSNPLFPWSIDGSLRSCSFTALWMSIGKLWKTSPILTEGLTEARLDMLPSASANCFALQSCTLVRIFI